MIEFLGSLEAWHWLALGLALLVVEISTGTFFILWLALASFVVGLLMLIMPGMSWEAQWIIFSVLAIGTVLAWRKFGRMPTREDHPNLNRRGAQYVGRTFTLDEAIENGTGYVKVDDSRWKVSGPDLASGTKVKVVDVQSTVFVVEAAED